MASQKRNDLLIPLLTVLSDILAIEGAFLLSYWLRFFSPLTGLIPVTLGIPSLEAYITGSLAVIPAWLFLFQSRRMYRARRNLYFSDEFFTIVRVVFIGMLLVMSAAFFYRAFSYSRLVFAMLGFSAVVCLSIGRFLVMKFEHAWYRSGHDLKSVVIVGHDATAQRIARALSHNPSLGYNVIGFFSARKQAAGSLMEVDHLGTIGDVPEYCRHHAPDLVLISLSYQEHPQLFELVRACEGLNVEMMMVPDLLEIMTNQVRVQEIEGIPWIRIKTVPFSTWNLIAKRSFDLIVASVILVLTSPLFALLAILIRLDSKGRIFYSQERVGLDGKPFRIIKFRTMSEDAEKNTGPVWASKEDPRTTRIGRFLRRFSLDELPQLWNVVRGEMSLVGPRPEREHFVQQFRKEIPQYLDRHRVKTGMTGWAQVNGLRGNAPIEERTKYDVYYVENWSLVFDLKIILKTIRAVLFGKDAY